MKICSLTFSYPRSKDDVQCRFMHLLCKELAKKHEVHIVTSNSVDTKKFEVIEGVNVHRFNYFFPRRFQRVTYGTSMAQILKESFSAKLLFPFLCFSFFVNAFRVGRKCDIFHAQVAYAGIFGVFANFFLKKPLVVTCRGTDINTAVKHKWLGVVMQFVLRRADMVVCVSDDLRDKVVNVLGIDKARVVRIANGVDREMFKPGNKLVLRKKLGVAKDKVVITFVGQLIEVKGVVDLIKAADLLVKKDKNILFLLVGGGSKEADYKAEVKKLGLDDFFVFTGYKKAVEVARFLGLSDVFVLPSLAEGRPNVILEAFATKLPVVSTNVGGIPELVEDGVSGYVVKKNNPSELAGALRKLVLSESKRKSMGAKGYDFLIRNGLTWESTGKRYDEVLSSFKKVISRRRS